MKTHRQTDHFRYLWSFTPSVFVLLGNLWGGHWAWGNIAYSLGFLVILDFIVPVNSDKNSASDHRLPDLLLWAASLLHLVCIFSLIYGIQTGILSGSFVWYAAASTGLNAGMLGITAAHELIHRKARFFKWLGIVDLLVVCYGHFFIEHRFGHHARVGTMADPATARFGEGFYRYLFRTVPSQWLSALHLEAGRLKRENRFSFGLSNFTLSITLVEVALFVVLWYTTSQNAALAWLMQGVVAFFLLEYVNYMQHYGLVRQKGEKVEPHHAWNSNTFLSRFFLFELSRHGHHHHDTRVPYHLLNTVSESKIQPCGYFGSFYAGLIPPVWFRLMNPAVEKARETLREG